MRKFTIHFLLFYLTGTSVTTSYSQKPQVDSLKLIAVKNGADSSIIDANKQLSILYQENDPDLAIYYGLAALEKSVHTNDNFRIGQSHKLVGIAYDIKGDLDSCLFHLDKALFSFKTVKRIDYQSHTLTDKALAYYYRGNFELALRNHLAALQLRKELKDDKYIAMSYLNIGLVYRSRKDYMNAVKFYQRSYSLKAQRQDGPGMLNSLINIGAAYQTNGQFDSAYHYGLQSLLLAKKINASEDIIAAKENIAASLVNLHRPDEALVYLREADNERGAAVDKRQMLTHLETYGDMYWQKGNLQLAIGFYKKGLAMANSNNRKEAMEVFFRKLAAGYYRQANYQLAYGYADSARVIRDTLLNAENSRQVNEMSAVYQSAEKEAEIEKLNASNIFSVKEARQRQRERNYFILSSLLLLGLAAVAYKAFVNNKKKKELLDSQNAIIEKSLGEKEILLREIHHRVKNNLQIVSSLLSLQSNYIQDEQALDAVKESRNRVQSMSLIHQNLYQEDNLTGIDVRQYITQLTSSLFHSYNIHSNRIKLEQDIETIQLDVDTIIPIGLILNELITNCLKYAFADSKNCVITVLLKQQKGLLLLSVHDNGAGLPPDFEHGRKKSFGHKMITAFLQKLKGTMKMYNQGGACVDIEIANYKLQENE